MIYRENVTLPLLKLNVWSLNETAALLVKYMWESCSCLDVQTFRLQDIRICDFNVFGLQTV